MLKEEKFGFTNRNFIASDYAADSLDYESYSVENLAKLVRARTIVNAVEKTNTFKGIVIKVLPTETMAIPGGLLDSIRRVGILNYENLQQVYVRIPELHAWLPQPTGQDDQVILRHSLCVCPLSEALCVGTVVTVQFNNAESLTYGIINEASAQSAVNVEEDYIPGTAPALPYDDSERWARCRTYGEVYSALDLANNSLGYDRMRMYLTRLWQTFHDKRGQLRGIYGTGTSSAAQVQGIQRAANKYGMHKCILIGVMKAESGGGKPAGIYGQTLSSEEPTIARARQANSTAYGVGQILLSSFLNTHASLALKVPHWAIWDPMRYGYYATAHVISATVHMAGRGNLRQGMMTYAGDTTGGNDAGGGRKMNAIRQECGANFAAAEAQIERTGTATTARHRFHAEIIKGSLALGVKPTSRYLTAATQAVTEGNLYTMAQITRVRQNPVATCSR